MTKDVIKTPLELLDDIIGKLELLITQADEKPLVITAQDPPRRSVYRPIGNVSNSIDRKPKPADVIFLDTVKMTLRCNKTVLVRLMSVEVTVVGGKNGRGEVSFIFTGSVTSQKRVRGGYETDIDIKEMRRVQITPGQKLRESVEKDDATSWNRWCQDIKDPIDLSGINLARSNLSGYDLCCADLTGADFSGCDLSNAILAGADLSNANLEAVKVTGTDFFRVKINRKHATLISASGMPEKESVIYTDN